MQACDEDSYCRIVHSTPAQARMLLTSTSEVYGDPQISPQKEDYWGHVNPIGPRACYDEGERWAAAML